jgi:Na+/citrate or Na+/malate symporter
VLVITFLPAFLVYQKWIPEQSVKIIDDFMKHTNFLNLFIIFIVVGSMFSMNRKILLKATSRIFAALIASQALGILTGIGIAFLLGLDIKHAVFFIIVPVMAGGVGEGALPLSIGYSTMMGLNQGQVFAQLLPCVFMGGLIGVIYAGLLNQLGLKKSALTGYGQLVKGVEKSLSENIHLPASGKSNFENGFAVLGISIAIYFISVLMNAFIALPVPIIVLILVILLKIVGLIPHYLETGGKVLYKFTVVGISPLLLFGVGVAMTPWEDLISVFTDWRVIVVLLSVVSAIVIGGFFIGRFTGLNEIDSAIVISCCSGQGGTGALAILAAGERMELMPFAQVAVRIGGAIVVTLALNLLKWTS